MSLFNIKSRTMFDIVKEADDDNTDAGAGTDAGGEAPAEEPAAGDEDFGSEDDFDIDTSLDDDGGGDDEGAGDDTGGTDDTTDDSSSYDSSGSDFSSGGTTDTDEEPVKKNTDIFSALTKEEQAIKIAELKRLYNDLFISIDDMLNKINDISPDEDTLVPLTKVSSFMYSLKVNMADYIEKTFPFKSFIENDIMYNRYLTIIQSITNVLDTLTKEVEEKLQKEDKK